MIIFLCIPLIIFAGIYGYFREQHGKKLLIWKALATCMAVLTSVYGVVQNGGIFGWAICAGLIFCMAADVLLEIRFRLGMVMFGAGHFCFIVAYWSKCAPSVLTGILLLVLYTGLYMMFRKDISKLGSLKKTAFVYMALLSTMVSLVITVSLELEALWTRYALVGGICFFISDVMIAWRTVKKKDNKIYNIVLLALYYVAVYLIAYAVVVG